MNSGKGVEKQIRGGHESSLMEQKPVVAWILDELRQTDVFYRHASKLTEGTTICPPFLLLPDKMNKILRDEIGMMLKARFINPAYSP